MDESHNYAQRRHKKSTHCMISFALKYTKCKLIYSYSKQIRDCWGQERCRRNYKGEEKTFGCNRHVYCLHCGDGLTGVNTHPNLSTWTFCKYMQFIACQLYLKKKKKRMCKFNSWTCLILPDMNVSGINFNVLSLGLLNRDVNGIWEQHISVQGCPHIQDIRYAWLPSINTNSTPVPLWHQKCPTFKFPEKHCSKENLKHSYRSHFWLLIMNSKIK